MAEGSPPTGWYRTPGGALEWHGGQAAFPGSWLELRRSAAAGGGGPLHPTVLVWQGNCYTPASWPLHFTKHELDQSPATLSLQQTVAQWRQRVEEATPSSGDRKLYLDVATMLVEKLGKKEEEVNEDYPAEILGLWCPRDPFVAAPRDGHTANAAHSKPTESNDLQLCGVIDCHVRTKTDALILKYVLAHPDSQLPAAERPHGAVGGVGQATLTYLVDRMVHRGLQCVRLEGISLRLYRTALALGFQPIASNLPPIPPDAVHN
eukprot:EG_transcript_21666